MIALFIMYSSLKSFMKLKCHKQPVPASFEIILNCTFKSVYLTVSALYSLCLCALQEVSALKCDQLLSSGQVLPSECVSGLVELAGNPNTSPDLTSSIISLLAQLGRHLCTYSITVTMLHNLHF